MIPGYGDMFRFYWPLMATNILMMFTHSVISNAAARSFNPVVAMAGYSAAYGVGQFLDSVNFAAGRMCLTYTRGQKSYKVVLRATQILVLGSTLSFLALVATPLSRIILGDLLGLKGDVYQHTVESLWVMTIFPFVDGLRQVYQSQIILKKKTIWMTANMGLRVVCMLVTAAFLPVLWPRGPVGACILMSGVGLEGVLSYFAVKKGIPSLELEPENAVPTIGQVLAFSMPLIVAGLVQNLGRPMITAALSRTLNPDLTLAGYQVALSFSYIFASVTYSVYQAVLVYVRDRDSYQQVKTFCFSVGAAFTLIMLIFTLPGVGDQVFTRLIGTDPLVTEEVLKSYVPLTLTPLAAAIAEFYDGVLTLKAHSSWVTSAKITNVAVSSIGASVIVHLNPGLGGQVGGLAVSLGSIAEALFAYYAVSRLPDTRVFLEKRRTIQPETAPM